MPAKRSQSSHKPGSLGARILADIGGRILSGEWPPGHRIPFEHELSVQFGCSRMTVNKAMSELARSGLIERRRRSGSFVRQPRSQAAVLEIHDIRAEVEALGLTYRFEIVHRSQRKPAGGFEPQVDFAAGAKLLYVTCRHFAGTRPFALEQRAISLDEVPDAASEPFDSIAPGPWLLSRVPWSSAEHSISAFAASQATAAMLLVPRNSACLVVRRRTWRDLQPITSVQLTYPGAMHTLVARFTP